MNFYETAARGRKSEDRGQTAARLTLGVVSGARDRGSASRQAGRECSRYDNADTHRIVAGRACASHVHAVMAEISENAGCVHAMRLNRMTEFVEIIMHSGEFAGPRPLPAAAGNIGFSVDGGGEAGKNWRDRKRRVPVSRLSRVRARRHEHAMVAQDAIATPYDRRTRVAGYLNDRPSRIRSLRTHASTSPRRSLQSHPFSRVRVAQPTIANIFHGFERDVYGERSGPSAGEFSLNDGSPIPRGIYSTS